MKNELHKLLLHATEVQRKLGRLLKQNEAKDTESFHFFAEGSGVQY